MKYKKSTLTSFAKDCAKGSSLLSNGIIISGEIANSSLGREVANLDVNDSLLIEISKRFAKHVNSINAFDAECEEVQIFQDIIAKLYECCEEHDWFDEEL